MFCNAEIDICAVAVLDRPGSDGRTDDHREKNGKDHADPLEMAGFLDRRVVPDHSRERCGYDHISGHHDDAGEDDRDERARKIERDQTGEHYGCGRKKETEFADFVNEAAGGDTGDRSRDQDNAEHDRIIVEAKVVLHIDDEVRHEDLHGDREETEGAERDVERLVGADDRRRESVQDVTQERRGYRGSSRLFYEEDRENSGDRDCDAEDREKELPMSVTCHRIENSENDQHGDQGKDREDGLRTTAILCGCRICDIGVESGIIRRRSEKGHDTIEDNDEDCGGRDGVGIGEKPGDQIDADESEGEEGGTPEKIAGDKEDLAASQTVREGSNEERRESCDDRTRCDHHGYVIRVRGDCVVKKDVEVHVLDRPGELPDQSDNQKRSPDPSCQFLHTDTSLCCVLLLL